MRVTLHQAGAIALSELLQFEAPATDRRQLPCACGHQAKYQELRSRSVLTVVGWARMTRPWYLCDRCHQGQFPADEALDVKDTDFSPGVRRMQAMVGQETPFDQGREQMKVLAGLEVTAKSVERTAEAIGADIAQSELAADTASRPTGPARHYRRADPHSVCADGWDGRAGGEERDRGA